MHFGGVAVISLFQQISKCFSLFVKHNKFSEKQPAWQVLEGEGELGKKSTRAGRRRGNPPHTPGSLFVQILLLFPLLVPATQARKVKYEL